MYPASGISTDWVHSQGITHAYTIELPDQGKYGFLTPVHHIIEICESTWKTIKCLFQVLKNLKVDEMCILKNKV